jgi:peptidyl-dipeptidase Dcp
MPEELLNKVLAASQFDMGFQTVEYVASAMVDLAFHTGPAPADPMQRQAEVLAELGMPRAIGMRHATPHFAHVFAGDGYSSGYYSYMWSEVMDADAFAAFEEAGDAFDPERARALEENILSRGGSEDRSEEMGGKHDKTEPTQRIGAYGGNRSGNRSGDTRACHEQENQGGCASLHLAFGVLHRL